MQLLIVESPAKAKTISKYLGNAFKVLASFGHVRDLPPKNGSINPDNNFDMKYEIIPKSKQYIKDLIITASQTSEIYLATDPDREGEAIAWHIIEVFKEKHIISNVHCIYRVVFNEITKNAVQKAIQNPRKINMDLVQAQQARRALDYLIGFNISPLLWKKLHGSKSAGRVQSVVLRLICEREDELNKFILQKYYSIEAEIQSDHDKVFHAILVQYQNQKLDKYDISSEEQAQEMIYNIQSGQYTVSQESCTQIKKNPAPPFVTSTLQQEGVRKLHLNVKNIMRIAQSLYEGIDIGGETVGLITYMRTDGFHIADEAIISIRKMIESIYGVQYLPQTVRNHKKKIKNTQEAHEAIRPTDITRIPNRMTEYLTQDQFKLYELIWKRTIASQMESTVLHQVVCEINSSDKKILLRASGSNVLFDGYSKIYQDSNIDIVPDIMPPIMKIGERCKLISVKFIQHFTRPPLRYSEASIVQKMEELGIGRPSTYATIISVLKDRGYILLDKKTFIPSNRGKIVTIFLKVFFDRYVEYDFTADMEEKLDAISNGHADWKRELSNFWTPFFKRINSVNQMTHDAVISEIHDLIIDSFYSEEEKKHLDIKCYSCTSGILKLTFGRMGVFFGCSNYPICRNTKDILHHDEIIEFPKSLGIDPHNQQEILIKKGPFGLYLQYHNNLKKKKSISIPKDIKIQSLDLHLAIKLLSLPSVMGNHPDTGKSITLYLGRFGYYCIYDNKYFSLKKSSQEILNMQLSEICEIITYYIQKALKSLGYDAFGTEVFICHGRYGLYIKHHNTKIKLSEDIDIENLDLKKALELINNQNTYLLKQ
ncbi:type I DNA topoisomerase [Wolbachia endosymbiont of Howardula sp.]|uniref:type I DNA topoisomerase n=1 Tax=Wolbachia endosymbiont of Howardula sp. TaxID=2916816 RepID=UPI00217DD140|nr:type I DNA topoisomerase [Wolbachia endosymbiont of Howardula sp.]UWI83348.1 type I DNA topoisomerase [Wolbachia endosymbiont of Howardula sp.]